MNYLNRWNDKYNVKTLWTDVKAIVDAAYYEYGIILASVNMPKMPVLDDPIITESKIQLSGDYNYEGEEQVFELTSPASAGTCDTKGKPYSVVVHAILLRMFDLFEDEGFAFESEYGEGLASEAEAVKLYAKAFGREPRTVLASVC